MTEISQVAVVFPFFMASLVFVRKALRYLFSEDELDELDCREEKPMDDDVNRSPSKVALPNFSVDQEETSGPDALPKGEEATTAPPDANVGA
eukprot:CAMPEP_0178398612 /NCGR_PEP_ID=MMETSP0689_2-20121128/14862_1 /TAXON_ID=160604 /ORGANISM="Amphidinium massartii, Strain CS-259" /LENGTH=91 /DNA_ID=CAMNT_0020019379 /DNA_START=1 /DNA_END=276 /DNA_ORIENTATION=+